jgi:PAS domain S-box-containing protein
MDPEHLQPEALNHVTPSVGEGNRPRPNLAEFRGGPGAIANRRQTLILVIDDDLEVRESTVRILEKAGFCVVSGATAAEALSLTRLHQPALALLDVVLPDGSGLDAAQTLKQDPALAGVFIILLSGVRISPQEQAEGLSKGLADGYITRPLSQAEFLARIDAFLRIRAKQEALRESEKHFRLIAETITEVFWIADIHIRTMLYISPGYERMWGRSVASLYENPRSFIDAIHVDDRERVVADMEVKKDMQPFDHEYRIVRPDGDIRWIWDRGFPILEKTGQVNQYVGIAQDITERKLAKVYAEVSREILQILNDPEDSQDSIRRVIVALKTQTGFDAVGIRLQDGDDFPYFAQEGFSEDFLQMENSLVERTVDGGLRQKKDGDVRLECTCGLVISGKIDLVNPLFTQGGSCWTNDSSQLLDIPPGDDLRLNPRNQCVHQGYASLALIPIRNRDKVVGLIQLNDRRKGRLNLVTIELLEGIASHIGSALMRKRAEDILRESEGALRTLLAEKEILIKEVHHRVKNNLAVIMGLLDLQGNKLIADEAARCAMVDISARIRSMSLVHEQLYQSRDFSRIDFQGYLEALTAYLRSSYHCSGDIHFSVAAVGVEMGLDIAVPCGLLITELVTNAIKYAFPADRPRSETIGCEIAVSAECDDAAYTLTVADNGVGLPADLDWTDTKTLGLLLVKMLGEHQLQGKIELDCTSGTKFRLRFKNK